MLGTPLAQVPKLAKAIYYLRCKRICMLLLMICILLEYLGLACFKGILRIEGRGY